MKGIKKWTFTKIGIIRNKIKQKRLETKLKIIGIYSFFFQVNVREKQLLLRKIRFPYSEYSPQQYG